MGKNVRQLEYVKVCQGMSRYVKVCKGMLRYVKVCQGMSRCVKLCQGMSRYVKVCQGMSRYVKVCQGMSRSSYPKVSCKLFQQLAASLQILSCNNSDFHRLAAT